jgi:hypothetical protein
MLVARSVVSIGLGQNRTTLVDTTFPVSDSRLSYVPTFGSENEQKI